METQLREAKTKSPDIPASLREQIVLEHTPLIRYIVSRIAVRLPSHIDLDDLHNTGVIGLMDAIEKYDPEKNCKFKTYAEFRIKGAILDQLRSLDWVPRSIRQKSRKLERAYGEVEQRLGRSASEDEVADSLVVHLEDAAEVVAHVGPEPQQVAADAADLHALDLDAQRVPLVDAVLRGVAATGATPVVVRQALADLEDGVGASLRG